MTIAAASSCRSATVNGTVVESINAVISCETCVVSWAGVSDESKSPGPNLAYKACCTLALKPSRPLDAVGATRLGSWCPVGSLLFIRSDSLMSSPPERESSGSGDIDRCGTGVEKAIGEADQFLRHRRARLVEGQRPPLVHRQRDIPRTGDRGLDR